MATVNNSEFVKEQYKSSDNLSIRISIHNKYSVNKQGFGNWIASNYRINPGMRILELGCGTGDMWSSHRPLLDGIAEIVLTDISEGMLSSSKTLIGEGDNISYKIVDIQDIPFPDSYFDIVIANMMLYHVPDINKGLSEVRRVLSDNGTFYSATYGEHGIMDYITSLLRDYGVKDNTNKIFTLQSGGIILSDYFSDIKRLDYKDSLRVTNINDMMEYIYSFSQVSDIANIDESALKNILESNMVGGVLSVPKEYGMFVCKNPVK